MLLVECGPAWFLVWDLVFEVIFALAVSLLALLAFRVHRSYQDRSAKLLGLAFLLIAGSYWVESLIHVFDLSKVDEFVCGSLQLPSQSFLHDYSMLLHMAFMILGLLVLLFMSFQSRDVRPLAVLLVLSFAGIISSAGPVYSFLLFSSVLLFFIAWHFMGVYIKTFRVETLLVAAAFSGLFLSRLLFLLSLRVEMLYIWGHVIELLAYVLLMVNLAMVLRR